MTVEDERLNEGARPPFGPLMNRNALLPGVQVFECSGSIGFGEPVRDEESEIVMAVLKASVGDCGFVELVNAYRDKFDLCSGMLGFEETGFFSKCVFKVGVVAKGDAQSAHAASDGVARDLRGFVPKRAMT